MGLVPGARGKKKKTKRAGRDQTGGIKEGRKKQKGCSVNQ